MYYLIQNKIISKTCSDEPDWLKKFDYWKIVTSPDLKESIIISEKEISIIPTDRVDIRKLTVEQAQTLENNWHPDYTVEQEEVQKLVDGKGGFLLDESGLPITETVKVNRTINPVSIKSFNDRWNKIKNRIEKIKEKKNG